MVNSCRSGWLCVLLMLSGCHVSKPHYQGYVEVEHTYLSSFFAGTLQHLAVVRGQFVKKGQLLFRLDVDPEVFARDEMMAQWGQSKALLSDLIAPKRPAEIATIEAQVAQAEAQVRLAALRVQRNQILYDKRVLDADSLDAAKEHYTEVTQLKAQYVAQLDLAHLGARTDQIRAQSFQTQVTSAKLKNAQWSVAQKSIYAPRDGLIFDTYFTEGEIVGAQQPVLALLVPRHIHVDFFVPAEEFARLHVGQEITVMNEGTPGAHKAIIRYLSPDAEYVPPLIYSRANLEKLVFRVKADPVTPLDLNPGQAVDVILSPLVQKQTNKPLIWLKIRHKFATLRSVLFHDR